MVVIGFLSTFPPTRCGLATFTAELAAAMTAHAGIEAVVLRVDDLVPTGPSVDTAGVRVVGDLRPEDEVGRTDAALRLDRTDLVIVQHEYGIYGGPDGDEILDVLARLTVPTVVVLHTVRSTPTAHQRWILQEIARLADRVVVMTHAASDLLQRRYAIAPDAVRVIAHGVPEWHLPADETDESRPMILTWGLLGPGKGIEWVIRALPLLGDAGHRPLYRVLGQTHPKVLRAAGESYRASLLELARDLGVDDAVEIAGVYTGSDELARQVARATAIVLPYDSRDQTTSGVLAEAVAAGKWVIATRFPHSVEVLGGGRGAIVRHKSPEDLAAAIADVLEQRVVPVVAAVEGETWPSVAGRYIELAAELTRRRAA